MSIPQDTSTSVLRERCRKVRLRSSERSAASGLGTSAVPLSLVEALVVIYARHMRIDPRQPKLPGRDRFVLSKGHGGPGLYAVLASFGYFPEDMLTTLNRLGTNLPSHADMNGTPGVDMTTGSLGQGLSAAAGIAAGARIRRGRRTRLRVDRGRRKPRGSDLGSRSKCGPPPFEQSRSAFTDYNNMQIDGSIESINGLAPLVDKWKAFNWNAVEVDGHDIDQIDAAIVAAKKVSDRPSMIVLNTVKGKGVSFIENAGTGNHMMALTAEQVATALEEIAAGR